MEGWEEHDACELLWYSNTTLMVILNIMLPRDAKIPPTVGTWPCGNQVRPRRPRPHTKRELPGDNPARSGGASLEGWDEHEPCELVCYSNTALMMILVIMLPE